MGRSKKYNLLAAQLRIIKASSASVTLQDRSVTLHTFHCELLQHNVHFPSYAVDQCSSHALVSRSHARWAKRLHQAAATERHEVFSTEAGFEGVAPPAAPISTSVLNVPLPSHAKVHLCADLEQRLCGFP